MIFVALRERVLASSAGSTPGAVSHLADRHQRAPVKRAKWHLGMKKLFSYKNLAGINNPRILLIMLCLKFFQILFLLLKSKTAL